MVRNFHLLILDTYDPYVRYDGYVPELDLVTHGVNMRDLFRYTDTEIKENYYKAQVAKKELTDDEADQICAAKYGDKGTMMKIEVHIEETANGKVLL